MAFVAAVLCSILLLFSVVCAYSGGPPVSTEQVCIEMNPTGHGVSAQTSSSPYEIVLGSDCYKEQMQIPVVIRKKSEDGADFKGVFVMAKEISGGVLDKNSTRGTFSAANSDLKTLSCFSSNNSALGHKDAMNKTCQEATWTPPPGVTGNITLVATIVQKKDTYWLDVRSKIIMHSGSCSLNADPPKCPTGSAPAMASISFGLVMLMMMAQLQP